MTIPKTIYELLKLVKDFGFGVISLLSALLLALGVSDAKVVIITLCISTGCQFIVILINSFSKNHWKAKAQNGELEDIQPIEEEN